MEKNWERLGDLDMALVRWAMEALGISIPFFYSSKLQVEGTVTDRLVNLCRAVGADCYLSRPWGQHYMDLDVFAVAGIEVRWQQFTSPVYPQVFPGVGFIPDLSIVHSLFSCGPETKRLVE